MIRTTPVWARILALWILLMMCCTYGGTAVYAQSAGTSPTITDTYNANTPEILDKSDLIATSALLIDSKRNEILFEKDAYMRMFPASTTKVMTLLLALEYGRLDEEIIVPLDTPKIPTDSSIVPVFPGERMPFRDLLYGLMLHSGNDAANAIAIIVAGSIDAFVAQMNARALELGCKNTHFANAHGYHDDNHYTTAYDLALITIEAMKLPEFRKIASARTYNMAETNKHDARTLTTTDLMLLPNSPYYYQLATGVKTGSTSKAGQCFIGSAQKNGRNLLSVALNSTENGRWQDTHRLFEYGYAQYDTYSFTQLYDLVPIYASIPDAHPDDANEGLLRLHAVPGAPDDYRVMCFPDEFASVVADFSRQLSVEYTRELTAPVVAGDVFGTLTLEVEGSEPLTTLLVAEKDIRIAPQRFSLVGWISGIANVEAEMIQFIMVILLSLVALIVGLRIRRNIIRRRRRAKKRKRKANSQRATR